MGRRASNPFSLGVKITITTVGLLLVVSCLVSSELLFRARASVLSSKAESVAAISDVLAEGLVSALDFEDADSAASELSNLRANADVLYAAAWLEGRAAPLASLGEVHGATSRPPAIALSRMSDDEVVAVRPIRRRDGKVLGMFELHVSVVRENVLVAEVRRRILLLSVVVTAATVMVLLVAARMQLLVPLARLSDAARRVAAGEREVRVVVASRDELGELSRAFNTMSAAIVEREANLETASRILADRTEALSRSNADLQQFAFVASHDLQEPLRMVISFTQLLSKRYRGQLDREADEFIGFAVDGAVRMQRLLNDLLEYSRLNTRARPLEPIDLEKVLADVVTDLQVPIGETGAVVTHDSLPIVNADAGQLAQLLQNLIANSLKFRGNEPPVIHVAGEEHGDEWRLSVRDNGIGIDAANHERIFAMFQRLHTQKEYPGTGIGLALCKRIVDRLGGRIWVTSELGQGSTFHFSIPKHPTTEART